VAEGLKEPVEEDLRLALLVTGQVVSPVGNQCLEPGWQSFGVDEIPQSPWS